MARQSIRFNPAEKLFEAYLDFSGGLNTEVSNETLRDNELTVAENVDLSGRGSIRRRYGRVHILQRAGNAQGVFFYYRQNQAEPDIIMAVSGRLYVKEVGQSTSVEIPITDNGQPFTFQTTLPVEAVQYGKDLFVATGTKLVEVTYNSENGGWVAKTVTPYTPTVMEAIYIGTNGLADNPDAYVQDGTSTTLEVVGIKPAKRTGTVNQKLTMTAFINKPQSITSVEYKWEYKKVVESSWTLGRDWTADATGKTWEFMPDTATNYDIRVTARDKNNQNTTSQYTMTGFIVNQVESKSNNPLPVNGIQRCRKIVLHWDRILLAGDDTNPYQMYISDLQNPRYFPVVNTISFDTGKQEPITAMVKFRDMLVVFTKTTIQTLVGKSVEDYRRNLIHDRLGCIADRSAQVVGNNIIFLSHEGIMLLKPNPFILEVMNVQRADFPIRSEVPVDTNACAVVADNQYWIAFPDSRIVYRFYYEAGAWVKDVSSKLNIVEFIQYGEDVYELTSDGQLQKHDREVYNDAGETYKMKVETKYLDLSAAFNQKRLKNLYIIAGHFITHDVQLKTTVFADSATVLTPDSGQAVVSPDGTSTTWQVTTKPNFNFYAGTVFGNWIMGVSPFGSVEVSVSKATVRGKCRRVKIRFEHDQNAKCEIFGIGLEFKLKKV